MSQIGLKTSDLDLTFRVKLAFNLAKCLFSIFKSIWNFIFTLELFIEVLNEFETGDLDIQDQICHETSNVCVIPCEFLMTL